MTIEALAAKTLEAATISIFERASPKILIKIAKRLSKETLRLQVQFTKTFQDHLMKTFERSESIKTVISRDRPVPLEEIYVPITLTCEANSGLPDHSADPTLRLGCRFVLSGTGGAGKTVLLKHLLNVSKSNRLGFIPIFIELRNLEFDKGVNLETCIFDEITKVGTEESFELFKIALEEGLFALYLDGFDEIHPEEAQKALKYVRDFSNRYGKTSILITTRPQTGATTLRNFTVFHVEPLTKTSAISLIEKTDFDRVTKEKFLQELRGGLYEKHKTLMSLPILVAMMLLAYRTYADIPDRMTVFYGQAFETLYSIHDSENKELYKRTHHAGLAPDVFKTVLQALCYLSLSSHDIEFSEVTLNSYISRALSISNIDLPTEKYKNDLIHNVCILQPDGLSYAFVHRSFQEYFAALFAINYSGSRAFEVFDKIADVSGSAVPKMLMEIDEIKTKRYWLLPKMKHLIEAFDFAKSLPLYRKFSLFYGCIYVEGEGDIDHWINFEESHNGPINYGIISTLGEIVDVSLGFVSLAANLQIFNTEAVIEHCDQSDHETRNKFRNATLVRVVNVENKKTIISEYVMGPRSSTIISRMNFATKFSAYKKSLKYFSNRIEEELRAHGNIEDSELFS